MKIQIFILFLFPAILTETTVSAQELKGRDEILEKMTVANAYFMNKWPDVGKQIVTNRARASNIWTRAVYYEGLMKLHGMDPRP